MPDFEEHETRLRRTADAMLGDVVEFKIPPGDFVAMKAYVLRFDRLDETTMVNDPLNAIFRVKVRQELLPAPDGDAQFRARKLPGGLATVYEIAGDPADSDPGYWLLDIQEAHV